MFGHIMFIFLLWGPCAIASWQKSSHFPYLALTYILVFLSGVWMLCTRGQGGLWVPFCVAVYGLYAVSGGFYWIREQGDPQILHFDWKRALLGSK